MQVLPPPCQLTLQDWVLSAHYTHSKHQHQDATRPLLLGMMTWKAHGRCTSTLVSVQVFEEAEQEKTNVLDIMVRI